MKKVELSSEVALEFLDTGDIAVYLWIGDNYNDAVEFIFNIQEVMEEMLNDHRNSGGLIHSTDKAYLKLMGSALENNVNIAIDTLKKELQKP